jgi:hypothetical protein
MLPITGVGPHPLAVGTDRNKSAEHIDLLQRVIEFLCGHEQFVLSRLAGVAFCS